MGNTNQASVMQQLADKLRPSLASGRVKLSDLEACLSAAGAGAAVREAALAALREAGIKLVLDARWPAARALAPATDPVKEDPVQAARSRLEADRHLAPSRWAKRILTAVEEVGLTLLARPGGEPLESGGFATLEGESRAAGEAMLLHNTGLVHRQAQLFTGQGMDYDDLVTSGIAGLIRAIELFDPSRGLKFSTYAVHWIRQSMSRAIDDEARLIRLPVYVCEQIRQIERARTKLVNDGRSPHDEAVARECGITRDKVEQLRSVAPAVLYLETPLGNDGFTLLDAVQPRTPREEHIEVRGLFTDDVDDLLLYLRPQEADVLRRRHGLSPYDEAQTLETIGDAHGFTRERARQVEAKALAKIRSYLRSRGWDVCQRTGRRTQPAAGAPNLVEVA